MSITQQLSTWEILEETIEAYSPDPENLRATSASGGCAYLTDSGKMCALGRCMKDPPKISFSEGRYFAKYFTNLDTRLKARYQGHPVEFWTALQALHDDPENWCYTGLSEIGEAWVKFIQRVF